MLIEHGAVVDKCGKYGDSPLHAAARVSRQRYYTVSHPSIESSVAQLTP